MWRNNMTETLTIEYNPLSNFAQQIVALLRVSKDVKIIESPYDPKYVKEIKKAAKGPMTRVKREDLWK